MLVDQHGDRLLLIVGRNCEEARVWFSRTKQEQEFVTLLTVRKIKVLPDQSTTLFHREPSRSTISRNTLRPIAAYLLFPLKRFSSNHTV